MNKETHCNRQTDCFSCPFNTVGAIVCRHYVKGQHLPVEKCTENRMLFIIEGQILYNSEEYPGATLRRGEAVLQAIGSKMELLALTDATFIVYRFSDLPPVCEDYYKNVVGRALAPTTFHPLKLSFPLLRTLEALADYLDESPTACGKYIEMKSSELVFLLLTYQEKEQLADFFYPVALYTESFHQFVMQNYDKVKNVEDFARRGGYSTATFRRLFKNMYGVPAYEWILAKKREGILDDLRFTRMRISAISARYGFESPSHFAHFCKASFGDTPRSLRKRAANGEQIVVIKVPASVRRKQAVAEEEDE